MHIKRAWHLSVFIGIFEVLDYLLSPITTFKSTPMAGTPSLGLGINLKVSKFQRFQSSVNFAIFYSVMCISVLCFLHHRHSIWFYYPFCILLLLTPYCGYYCPRGGENLRFLCNFASHHCKTLLQSHWALHGCKMASHHCKTLLQHCKTASHHCKTLLQHCFMSLQWCGAQLHGYSAGSTGCSGSSSSGAVSRVRCVSSWL